MLEYPAINPVIIHISDTFQIRWYGLLYVIGFALTWLLLSLRAKQQSWPNWDTERQFDLYFYIALGVIFGGRIGYVLLYHPSWVLADPLTLIKIWLPGRAFHGGLLGVIVALGYFAKKQSMPFWVLADRIAPVVPIGLACGRLGNFMNGELWGKPTQMPWGMVFPHVDQLARHPAQLYAVFLEGILLFCVLWWFSKQPRKVGVTSGLFLLGYGLIRIIEEFFRQPDQEIGYLAWNWVTQGQLLCLPMVFLGLGFIIWHSRKRVL